MTDVSPTNCRFRLRDESKSHPRSSCAACGRTITTGLGRECHLSTYDAGFAAGMEAAAQYCETHTMEIAMNAADRKFAGMFVAGEPFGDPGKHHGMGYADALRGKAKQEE
jgi:hypothetical protein